MEGKPRHVTLVVGDREILVDEADFPLVSAYTWTAGRYALSCSPVKNIKMHVLIMGRSSHLEIDHRDGNGLDNRRHNLRVATHQQNSFNRRKLVIGRSRFKGVSQNVSSDGLCMARPWRARITITTNGARRVLSLGVFATEEAAARAYDRKAAELFGEFARLNFPQRQEAA